MVKRIAEKDEAFVDNTEKMINISTYNHCICLNTDGYCGYSNEHIAEMIGVSRASVVSALRTLRDNNFIIIKNEKSGRERRTGRSREIYINTSMFADSENEETLEEQITRLKEKK